MSFLFFLSIIRLFHTFPLPCFPTTLHTFRPTAPSPLYSTAPLVYYSPGDANCYRSVSPEPCFHRSFFFEDHFEAMVANRTAVRCEDCCGLMIDGSRHYEKGWKLLSLLR